MASEKKTANQDAGHGLAMVVCLNAGTEAEARNGRRSARFTDGSGLAQAFRLKVTNGTIWVGILFLTAHAGVT